MSTYTTYVRLNICTLMYIITNSAFWRLDDLSWHLRIWSAFSNNQTEKTIIQYVFTSVSIRSCPPCEKRSDQELGKTVFWLKIDSRIIDCTCAFNLHTMSRDEWFSLWSLSDVSVMDFRTSNPWENYVIVFFSFEWCIRYLILIMSQFSRF